MQSKKRVVITGLGLVTPLGLTVEENWQNCIRGVSGISKITKFETSSSPVKIAGEVKNFKIENYLNPKEAKKVGTFIHYAIAATKEALLKANLNGRFGVEGEAALIHPSRVGINISAGLGGLPEIQYWDRELFQKEKKVVSPFFVPMIIPNMLSGYLSIMTNAQGPNFCIVSACASSAHAIGEAYRYIQDDYADIMITGGAEAVVCELGIIGFASMKALSTQNETPEKASRPFDKDRDGFVLGEGSGILILEELEHAKKRGANIIAEICGYGLNADSYHMTSPAPNGEGGRKCMELALKNANLKPEDIGYINAHGTSTPTGDLLEAQAIASLFENAKQTLNVSSTKSMTGHLLGAAGAVEACFSILALRDQIIPPTINLENCDDEIKKTELNFTPIHAQKKNFNYALSNSFGFGGTNASLIFKKI